MRNLNYFLILALAWLLCPNLSHAQVVLNEENFPDANFRAFVATFTGIEEGQEIPQTTLNSKTTLDCSSKEIANLKGIEYFTKLTALKCQSNQLTSLDISKNTALISLYCQTNQLGALDVSHNTALTTLYCYSNQLKAIDVSQNTALTSLQCYSNQLKAIDVSQNTALTSLQCYSNQLTTLDVSANTALTTLSCYSNQLKAIDVSKNTALKYFRCQNNQITAIDVSKNTELTTFICKGNQIKALDVRTLTNLTNFQADQNQLTSIDLSTNSSLQILLISNNRLSALDLSSNTLLQHLECQSNMLPELSVSHLKALNYLNCRENYLKELVIAEDQTALKNIYCYANNMTVLTLPAALFEVATTYQYMNKEEVAVTGGKYGIEVDGTLELANLQEVKIDDVSADPTIVTEGGKKYLSFGETSLQGKRITYLYKTGYTGELESAQTMEVSLFVTDKSKFTETVAINETNFPDAVFREYVSESFDKDSNGELSPEEIAAVERIYLSGMGVADLKGIEFFPNLLILNAGSNHLIRLDVTNNPMLSHLNVSNNKLSALDVTGLKGLRYLGAQNNELRDMDVSSNVNVKDLRLGNNHLTAINLSNNPHASDNASLDSESPRIVGGQKLNANMIVINGKLAVPVSSSIVKANISDLEIDGVAYTCDLQTQAGTTYLLINEIDTSSDLDGKKLTYNYATQFSGTTERPKSMDVTMTLFSTSYVLTVGSAKMATLYLSYDANIPSGIEAWYLKDINESTAIMFAYPITTGVIPAETAVFVTADTPGDYVFTLAGGTAAKITDNILEGTLEDIDISSEPAHSYLCLSHGASDNRIGFWWYNGDVLHAHRCFVRADNVTAGAAAKENGYTIVFGDEENTQATETTGIGEWKNSGMTEWKNAPMYNLSGQRVGKDYRGIVIVNGKKYVK